MEQKTTQYIRIGLFWAREPFTHSPERRRSGARADHIQTPSLCSLLFSGLFSSLPVGGVHLTSRPSCSADHPSHRLHRLWLTWQWPSRGGAHLRESDRAAASSTSVHVVGSFLPLRAALRWSRRVRTYFRLSSSLQHDKYQTFLFVSESLSSKNQTTGGSQNPRCTYVALHFPPDALKLSSYKRPHPCRFTSPIQRSEPLTVSLHSHHNVTPDRWMQLNLKSRPPRPRPEFTTGRSPLSSCHGH